MSRIQHIDYIRRINKFGIKHAGIIAIVSLLIAIISSVMPIFTQCEFIYSDTIAWRYLFWPFLGVSLFCMLIVVLKMLKNYFNRWRQQLVLEVNNSMMIVSDLSEITRLIPDQDKKFKDKIPICVIDDREAAVIKRGLVQLGFTNISIRQDLPEDNALAPFAILLVDIDGVGKKRNSNGLSFALEFKKKNPSKKIIIVSAVVYSEKLIADITHVKDVALAEKELDGIFTKGNSYDKKLKPILDKCLDDLESPVSFWKVFRTLLLDNGMRPADVMRWEDSFVRGIEHIYKESGNKLPYDWAHQFRSSIDDEKFKTLYDHWCSSVVGQ